MVFEALVDFFSGPFLAWLLISVVFFNKCFRYNFYDLESFMFFVFRFFYRFIFCVDFGSFCGPMLVPFGEAFGSPNRSFFALIFG